MHHVPTLARCSARHAQVWRSTATYARRPNVSSTAPLRCTRGARYTSNDTKPPVVPSSEPIAASTGPGAPVVREASSSSGFRGPVSWATLILVIGTGAGVIVYYNISRDKRRVAAATKVESYGTPALGGPWSLVASDGRPVTSADWSGQYTLLYFGFTFCPDICPNELVKMSKVVDALGSRKDLPPVTPVFITLDPQRDSCSQVGAYIKDFHPRMVGLTGTPKQVAAVARAFRVYFENVDRSEDDDYLVDHSIVMYLMGPDGKFLEFYTQLMTASEITTRIAAKIQPPAADDFISSIGRALGFGGRT